MMIERGLYLAAHKLIGCRSHTMRLESVTVEIGGVHQTVGRRAIDVSFRRA